MSIGDGSEQMVTSEGLGLVSTYTQAYINAMRSSRGCDPVKAHLKGLKASRRGYFLTQLSNDANPLGPDQPIAGTGNLWDGPPKIKFHVTDPWHFYDENCIYRGCVPYGGCYIAATRAISNTGITAGNAPLAANLRLQGGQVVLRVGGVKASQTSDRRVSVGAPKPVFVAAGNYAFFAAQVVNLGATNVPAPGFPFSILWTDTNSLAIPREYIGESLAEPGGGGAVAATTVPEGATRLWVENPTTITWVLTSDPSGRAISAATTTTGQVIEVMGPVFSATAAAAGFNQFVFLLAPL